MHSKMISLAAVMGMMSSLAFAEPAIQPGDTLESLSKARITTTVNAQAAAPAAQAPASNDVATEVKVEDIDPIIEESTPATTEAPKAETQQAAPAVVETVATPAVENAPVVAAAEATVNVEDIDVAHPAE